MVTAGVVDHEWLVTEIKALRPGERLTVGDVAVDPFGVTVVSLTTTTVVDNQRGTLALMIDHEATDVVDWLFTGGVVYERGSFNIGEPCPFEASNDVAVFLAAAKAVNANG